MGLGLYEDAAEFFGIQPPFARSTIDKFTEDMAVSGEKIQRELDFHPQYELINGWREALMHMANVSMTGTT